LDEQTILRFPGAVCAEWDGDPPFALPVSTESPEPARLIPVAYVAGPYRDVRGTYYVEQNIRAAEAVAVELWKMGFAVICPHTNTKHMDGITDNSADMFISGDLEIVRRCDVLVTMPNWMRSEGARNEVRAAKYAGVLVFEWSCKAHKVCLDYIGKRGREVVREMKRQRAERN